VKTKLIINADDFGLSHEVNTAVTLCFKKKYINQATLMMNMPGTTEAIQFAKSNGFANNIGLHLNLVEGMPLTEEIRETAFCDSDGKFIGSTMKNYKYRIVLDSKSKKAIKREIEAQIKAFISTGIGFKHLDSHQHSHVNPSILSILMPLLREYGFEDIRLSRNLPYDKIDGIKRVIKDHVNKKVYNYNHQHSSKEIIAFGSIDDIKQTHFFKGNTEMMIHPIMVNGTLSEAFYSESIDKWWLANELKFELL